MVNYKLGKIYKIVDNTNNNIYIGSTCEPTLSRRLVKHKEDCNRISKGNFKRYVSSYEILKNKNYDIVLLEEFSCESRDQLRKQERYYIDSLKCINKNIPSRTMAEYRETYKERNKEYQKTYREKNEEKILKKLKEYREKNKEKILKNLKEYREQNKEKILKNLKEKREQNKEKIIENEKKYYENNKEKILNARKQKIMCACGCFVNKGYKTEHDKTKKHLKELERSK